MVRHGKIPGATENVALAGRNRLAATEADPGEFVFHQAGAASAAAGAGTDGGGGAAAAIGCAPPSQAPFKYHCSVPLPLL